MKQTRFLMGMPVILQIDDMGVTGAMFDEVFDYLAYIDRKFSPFKPDSELTRLNTGQINLSDASDDMQAIFLMAQQTQQESNGYFQILHNGRYDPSGIVKGWAILQAARRIESAGFLSYYLYAGGDIQMGQKANSTSAWRVGIQNPFNPQEIIKALLLQDCGIATSGIYARGSHIYDPHDDLHSLDEIVSLTVIGPDVYEADRFATAAFAMGPVGIGFVEEMAGLEGYMIDRNGRATFTSGFERHVIND
jgi:FAD:protein FMN transferase